MVREATSLYLRIWRTYFDWARTLLPLAFAVFVPLGLVHAVPVHANLDDLGSGGLQILGLVIAALVLSVTGLVGEVFYTGAVAIALTHSHDGEQPSVREIARTVQYRRLIAVDLIYAAAVAVGLIVLFVPGFLIYVFFGLAAPVIEIERHGIRDGFRRSYDLVRGHFWLVAAVLIPIEVVGDGITDLATRLTHTLLGGSLLAEWLADTTSNIVLTPFYAVAAVLLTLDLIADRDGSAPRLRHQPPA